MGGFFSLCGAMRRLAARAGLCAALVALPLPPLVVSVGPGPARADTPALVTDLAGLEAVLAGAKGGETILLAPGDYGRLVLSAKSKFDITPPSVVTIASADPARPARFAGLDLRGAGNLIFDGVLFDYTFAPGHKIHYRPFQIVESEGITIRNSVFDGDLAKGVSPEDDGLGFAFGLGVQSSSDITIEGNTFSRFFRGLVMGGVSDSVVRGNEVHSVRMDGMNFAHMRNILIEGNYIHDFRRSTLKRDHADMIQFWTNRGTSPSTGITIRGNVLMSGDGGSTQSIFMRNDMVDRGLAGREMFYRDVVIEDNVIVNGHVHGITVGETEGLTIRRNTLLRNQAAVTDGKVRAKKVTIPRINLKDTSLDVVLEGNISGGDLGGPPGWTVAGNLMAQDVTPTQGGYYHTLFEEALLGDPRDLSAFAVIPGGPADRPGLGAPLLRPGADRSRYRPDEDG